MKLVYLSGPIRMVSLHESTAWRDQAMKDLDSVGIDVINPMEHPLVDSQIEEIITRDKRDVARADALLVNAVYPVQMWGTSMEVFMAWQQRIPVFTFMGNQPSSAWVEYHSTGVFQTQMEAQNAIYGCLGVDAHGSPLSH